RLPGARRGGDGTAQPADELPASPGQLDRRRHVRDHEEHPRRAGTRPPRRAACRQRPSLAGGGKGLKPQVLVTHRLPAGADAALDPSWKVWPRDGPMPRRELIAAVADVEGLL